MIQFPRVHSWALQIASCPPALPRSIYCSVETLLGWQSPLCKTGGLLRAFIPKVSLEGQEKRVPQKQDSIKPHPSSPPQASQPQARPLKVEAPEHHGKGWVSSK